MKFQIEYFVGTHRTQAVMEAHDTTQLLQRFLLILVDTAPTVDVTGIKVLSPTQRDLSSGDVQNFRSNVDMLHNAMAATRKGPAVRYIPAGRAGRP